MPGDMPNRDVLSEMVFPDLYESGISDLQKGLGLGHFTSVDLVKVSYYQPIYLFHDDSCKYRLILQGLRKSI